MTKLVTHFTYFFIIMGSFIILGCATVVEGTRTLTSFDSMPEGVPYTLYELFEGKRTKVDSSDTPSPDYSLRRADILDPYSYEIVFEYPTANSDTVTLVIDSEFSYWVIGNVATGFVGLVVDIFSGAWYHFSHPTTSLDSDPVYLDMKKQSGRKLDFVVVFETSVTQERLDELGAVPLPFTMAANSTINKAIAEPASSKIALNTRK